MDGALLSEEAESRVEDMGEGWGRVLAGDSGGSRRVRSRGRVDNWGAR